MEDKYGLTRQRNSGVWRSLRDGDFEEEDVWSVFKDKNTAIIVDDHQYNSPNDTSSRHAPPRASTSARAIPGPRGGGEASAKMARQSVPVNVPNNNWSTSNNKASLLGNYSGAWHGHDDDDDGDDCFDDDDDGFDDYEKLPPHELIARRLAKRHSVFEGVGRTLKGRDLSKVRNAVLTKTGFLESL